jgi:hypothetical protein
MTNRQNYLERIERNKKLKLSAGLLSERFPHVSEISIRMTYYQNSVNPVMMFRTVHFLPSHHAYFNMDCMIKDCNGGGFDLTSVITEMVKKQKISAKGKLLCKGNTDDHDSDHASIAYQISVKYGKTKHRAFKGNNT